MEGAVGLKTAVAIASLLTLAGCITNSTTAEWRRLDGAPIAENQAYADLAECKAAAMNVGNNLPEPPPSNDVTVNNTVVVQAPAPPSYNGAPTPASYQGPVMNWPAPGHGRFSLTREIARNQTENVNLDACMAQRGYRR